MPANKLPTINIKGKEYVMVKDRILKFNEDFPNGCIQTEIITPFDSTRVIVRAIVTPDVENGQRQFVDYSQAVIGEGLVNTTSALENASTSAVGRALAYMGIGVLEGVASADEIVKAENSGKPASEKQIEFVRNLLDQKGFTEEQVKVKYKVESVEKLTRDQASLIIDNLSKLPAKIKQEVDESFAKSQEEQPVKEEETVNTDDIPTYL